MICSNNPSPNYISQGIENTQTDICTPLRKAALFTLTTNWKQPKGPSAYEQNVVYDRILFSH